MDAKGGCILQVWDAGDGRSLLRVEKQYSYGVALDAAGRRVAARSRERMLSVTDVDSGREVAEVDHGFSPPENDSYSAGGPVALDSKATRPAATSDRRHGS